MLELSFNHFDIAMSSRDVWYDILNIPSSISTFYIIDESTISVIYDSNGFYTAGNRINDWVYVPNDSISNMGNTKNTASHGSDYTVYRINNGKLQCANMIKSAYPGNQPLVVLY